MTKICRICGTSHKGTSQIIKHFVNISDYKYGVGSVCKRCWATTHYTKIVGEFCLISENPKAVKTCECCDEVAKDMTDLGNKFRRIRQYRNYPYDYSPICKKCENTACLILAEFQYLIREGKQILKDSDEYKGMLTSFYYLSGFTTIPKTAEGEPVDVLQFHTKFSFPDGTPFIKSPRGILKVKQEVGYIIQEEDNFE